jgi:hypothetical protein
MGGQLIKKGTPVTQVELQLHGWVMILYDPITAADQSILVRLRTLVR